LWVIVALASLAVAIILVLCIPLDTVLSVDVYGRPKFQIKLAWLFGLVNKEITTGREKPGKEKRVVEGKRKTNIKTVFQILRTKGLLKQLKRLLKDIFKNLKIRDLRVNFRIGLDDPADTGLLFAFIGPATFFLGSSRVHEIKVEPSFEDRVVFEGYLSGALRLIPIRMTMSLLKFAFSPPAIRVLTKLAVAKWKRKK